MKLFFLLYLCSFLSAQYTIKMDVSSPTMNGESTIYAFKDYIVNLSNRQAQFYDAKIDKLYRINLKTKTLHEVNFGKVESAKQIVSSMISGLKTDVTKSDRKILGYQTTKKHVHNATTSSAHVNATLFTTEKSITPAFKRFMKKLRTMIPFDFPVDEKELVLEMDFSWKLGGMAKLFLTGKNKKYLAMSAQMKIKGIRHGVPRSFKELFSYKRL